MSKLQKFYQWDIEWQPKNKSSSKKEITENKSKSNERFGRKKNKSMRNKFFLKLK